MRRAITFFAVLSCACASDGPTATNVPLALNVSPISSAPRGTITAIVSNVSDHPVSATTNAFGSASRVCPCQRLVGSTWAAAVNLDTLPGFPITYDGDLAAHTSWTFTWTAPSDTGTYRVAMAIGTFTLISPKFTVR